MTLDFPNQGYLKIVETRRYKIKMHSKEKAGLRGRRDEIRLSENTLSVQALRKGGPPEARSERVEK